MYVTLPPYPPISSAFLNTPSLQEILRAEIEALRTGTDTADRVKALETQISELESESDRLSRALDAQKGLAAEEAAVSARKGEDSVKEVRDKVRFLLAFSL
jgi:homeobox protein cut-like